MRRAYFAPCRDAASFIDGVTVAAGLGGGSSDAAAVLLSLPVLAGRNAEIGKLEDMAARLGSDVPVFLHGGTALGAGRGTEVYPLPDLPAWKGLAVQPGVEVGTGEAYEGLGRTLTPNDGSCKLSSFQALCWLLGTGVRAEALAGGSANGHKRRPGTDRK